MPADPTTPGLTRAGRRRHLVEVAIVLGLSLGQSAVYAIVSLVAKLTQGPLRESTATLNASRSPRPYLDLTYQLLTMGFALVPVLLALFLLSQPGRPARAWIGLQWRHRDALAGLVLAAVIGLPGLGLYAAGRAFGITANVVPAALGAYWWSIPILLLAALQNALVEEVIVVGYLMTRLRQAGWPPAAVIAASAILRGSYHLYQGFGPFIGNVVMGILFGWVFTRTRRVMPLIVAHTVLDVVAFVGYWLFADAIGLR